MIVVSPHLDDAVLSCGQAIAGSATPVTVVTVFAGAPPGHADEVQVRRDEDVAALAELGAASGVHWNYLDRKYRQSDNLDADTRDRLHAQLRSLFVLDDVVVGPLGIRHPDHVLLGMTFRDAAKRAKHRVWCYEELPYRVEEPALAVHRVANIGAGWNRLIELSHPAPPGPVARKMAALERYPSELPDPHRPEYLVAERFWMLTPA